MNKTILTGILTSKIETRTKGEKTYYYGFFQVENQNREIPVIFKGDKPNLLKGSQLELTGT